MSGTHRIPIQANHWLSAAQPLIIAHRGASTLRPENTLAAFALAVEQGADGVELDVRLSKDGHPVLVHDATLLRISGNPQKVSQLTLGELQQEDCGHGQTVAHLSDLFELIGEATLYNIELKDFGWRDQGLTDRVAEVVEAYGLQSRTLISSFNPLLVERARKRFDALVAIALLRAPGISRYCYLLTDVNVDNPHYSLVDRGYMDWTARRGLYTFVWTVDDAVEGRRLLDLGVHGIITNEPARLRRQLGLG